MVEREGSLAFGNALVCTPRENVDRADHQMSERMFGSLCQYLRACRLCSRKVRDAINTHDRRADDAIHTCYKDQRLDVLRIDSQSTLETLPSFFHSLRCCPAV